MLMVFSGETVRSSCCANRLMPWRKGRSGRMPPNCGMCWKNSRARRSNARSILPVENRMTKRETDVVKLAVEGLSNREIARSSD